jgi:hypothetical protein
MTEPNPPALPTPQAPQPLPIIPAANPSTSAARPRPNFGQQAARASWMAPLIAVVIGLITFQARDADRSAAMIIGGANVLIIVAGGVLGIVALLGVRKWGREGVLLPASIGVLVFIVLALSMFTMFQSLSRVKQAQQQRAHAQAAEDEQLRKEGEDAFLKHAGWVGAVRHGDAVVTLITVPDTSLFVREMQSNLNTPVSMLVLLIDNTRGGAPVTIDHAGAVVHFTDGTSRPMPDLVLVLRSAKTDPREALQTLGPPLSAEAGKRLAGKFLFLPPKTDPSTIDHVAIGIDSARADVPGRFLTAEEKQATHQAARDQPAQPAQRVP